MYKKYVTVLYCINYVSQAVFTLLTPVAIGALISWLLTAKCNVGSWIWAVLIIVGVFVGLYSMVRYLIKISEIEKRREKDQEKNGK